MSGLTSEAASSPAPVSEIPDAPSSPPPVPGAVPIALSAAHVRVVASRRFERSAEAAVAAAAASRVVASSLPAAAFLFTTTTSSFAASSPAVPDIHHGTKRALAEIEGAMAAMGDARECLIASFDDTVKFQKVAERNELFPHDPPVGADHDWVGEARSGLIYAGMSNSTALRLLPVSNLFPVSNPTPPRTPSVEVSAP